MFTDIKDDEYGGDSNNGNNNCPTLDNWPEMHLTSTETSGVFNHCVFRFSEAGIKLGSGSVTVKNCLFDHNEIGVWMEYSGDLSIDSTVFANNDRGVKISSGHASIHHSAFHHNPYYDIENLSVQSVNAVYNWWGAANTSYMQLLGPGKNVTHIYDDVDNPEEGTIYYFPPLSTDPRLNLLDATFEFDRIGNEVYFYNTSSYQDTLTYTWDFGDGSAPVTHLNPSHQYKSGSLYEVCRSTLELTTCEDSYKYCQMVAIPGVSHLTPNQSAPNNLYIAYLHGVL